jgi:general secretion pathway protein D
MMMKLSSWKHMGVGCLLAGVLAGTAQAQFTPFGGGFGGGTGGGTAARTSTTGGQPLGGADISFDAETRQMIIVTDDKTMEQMKTVLKGLDRPSPQVLIKVIFLEATYNKGSDIGFSGGYMHNPNSAVSSTTATTAGGVTTTTTTFLPPAGSGIVGQGFGNPTIATIAGAVASGGGIYSILGNDFQATLTAIARAGKTEVLSRPSILARNNQSATITLGQQVPLITNTRFDNFGNQINTVTYQSVGVNLSVTPFISSDGNVEMTVTPEISSLADRSQWVAISGGATNASILAPVINSRAATTTVVVPNGQTVIIGGLMENTQTESESKVPGLGDIPLLGNLFKRKVKDNVKRELMIFLTPTIVQAPAQLAGITQSEQDNKVVTPRAFSQEELDRFLDALPNKTAPPAPAPNAPTAPAPGKPSPK